MDRTSYNVFVFGDFKNIEYNTETVLKLMELFKDFNLLPNSIQEFNPQISMVPISRPFFSTIDNSFSIEIGAERIAIRSEVSNNDLQNFTKDVLILIDKVFESFEKKSTRVSLVQEMLFPEFESEKLDSIYRKFNNPIDYYMGESPLEWHTTSVLRSKIEDGEVQEVVNNVTSVNRVQGAILENLKEIEFDRINLKVDINTIPQKTEDRLTSNHIKVFLDYAVHTSENIISQVESVVNG